MPLVTFLPSQKSAEVPEETDLIEASRLAGVEIESQCGREGTCGKCVLHILSGAVRSESLGVLSSEAIAEGQALACKTKVLRSEVIVEVPEQIESFGEAPEEAEDESFLLCRPLFPENFRFDPLTLKRCVSVTEAEKAEGLSDLDRLSSCAEEHFPRKEITYSLSSLQSLAEALRSGKGKVSLTLTREPMGYRVIHIEPGDTTDKHYGIAVDVGTTTVGVQLVHLPDARVIATWTDYNQQIACGLDVISRINYAAKPGGLSELSKRVLNTINRLIEQAVKSHDLSEEEISGAVISGNTTMLHLLLGLNPEYIRLEPYTPTFLDTPMLTAGEIGLEIHPAAAVYVSPCVGSYVGGDITAGVLVTDLAGDSEEISLFIDIGTNGELVVGNRDFLMTCACSAGPAFEGGGIEHGVRAALGAIERVEVDAESGKARYWTIGEVRPRGICGSGMITLLANLFLTGWVDAAGKLDRTRECESIEINGRRAQYIIAPASESETGRAITVGERDFENIIRAKAAIYSACSLMLKEIGIEFKDLAKVYIAGAFGRFLDLEKATAIGLIPDVPKEKFHYLGNSSLAGTHMVLVSLTASG